MNKSRTDLVELKKNEFYFQRGRWGRRAEDPRKGQITEALGVMLPATPGKGGQESIG